MSRFSGWITRLKNDLAWNYVDIYGVTSYSQEGEDMILRRIFENVDRGFYVDVGAHHPIRFSNTYYFYKNGWSGINIDATPGSMALFRRKRPRDINIELAVSNNDRPVDFFMFDDPALNTFDENLARQRANDKYHITGIEKLSSKALKEILAENLPKGRSIQFMSVDVEGCDLEAIQSNDWERFRPEYLLVEFPFEDFDAFRNTDLYGFMTGHDYSFFAKTLLTVFFRDKKSSHG